MFLLYSDINECEAEPCRNGGICTDLVANYSCECPGEYMGRNCQHSKCYYVNRLVHTPAFAYTVCIYNGV